LDSSATTTEPSNHNSENDSIPIIVGCLVGVVLIIIFISYFVHRKWQKRRPKIIETKSSIEEEDKI
jgi:preprotein translocase subunit YajC